MSDAKSSYINDSSFDAPAPNRTSVGPPPGPPPPRVPEGWLAQWDSNYKQFYYVNLATGKSQWEPPVDTSTKPGQTPPPSYDTSRDNRPQSANSQPYMPQQPQMNPQPQTLYPPANAGGRSSSGLGSKISKLFKGGMHQQQPIRPGYGTAPPSHYNGGIPPQNQYYQQPSQPMMGSPYAQQYGSPYGGPQYGQPQYGYAQPQRRQGGRGGMGMLGGAGLGLAGGMLGGALLADAMNDNYEDGYQDAMENNDFGGDDGGDFDF
ncbi:hypothetical protein BZA77DRAFT_305618 [Pyronema omphalodes]|nr:hypothetical protein BZA77DRAFT_305618 [Pyronema omphalodes]